MPFSCLKSRIRPCVEFTFCSPHKESPPPLHPGVPPHRTMQYFSLCNSCLGLLQFLREFYFLLRPGLMGSGKCPLVTRSAKRGCVTRMCKGRLRDQNWRYKVRGLPLIELSWFSSISFPLHIFSFPLSLAPILFIFPFLFLIFLREG